MDEKYTKENGDNMKKKIVYLLTIALLASMMSMVPINAQDEDFDINIVNKKVLSSDLENLESRSFILIEATTGQVLKEKNSNFKYPMASLTKIMTTYIIMDEIKSGNISYDDMITASEYACGFGGSQVWLAPGEQFTLLEMINAIELHSANDVAVAVAEAIAGNEASFVKMMNNKAKELEMNDTKYLDCTGLTDDGHYSTASDIAKLAQSLVQIHPEILEITSKIYEPFREGKGQVDMYNRNKLIQYYKGATGLKTGFTTLAGHCLAATAEREGFSIISVLMGAPNTNTRFAESILLLDHGFSDFAFFTIEDGGLNGGDIPVEKGIETKVGTYVENDSVFLLKKTDFEKIERVVNIPEILEAPIEKGVQVGEIKYMLEDEQLGSTRIITSSGAEKAGFFQLIWRKILSWFGIKAK